MGGLNEGLGRAVDSRQEAEPENAKMFKAQVEAEVEAEAGEAEPTTR